MADEITIEDQLERQRTLTLALLRRVGDVQRCKGCNATIYWVRHSNDRPTPYDPTGEIHFATCPKADQFKKKENHATATGKPFTR